MQSFGYGPHHSVKLEDATKLGSGHHNVVVNGVPILNGVRNGVIHFGVPAGSVTVTFRNAFDDWHRQKLAMVFLPCTLVASVSRFSRDELQGRRRRVTSVR